MAVKPVLKFKVYVRCKRGPKTPYFWCSIWRTLPQMRSHMRDIGEGLAYGTSKFRPNRYKISYGACYSWKATNQSGARLPEMGVIVLALPYTGASIISHECSHAAFRFTERIAAKRTAEYLEELHCCVVGEMSEQIVHRLSRWDRRRKCTTAVRATSKTSAAV